MDGFTLPVRIYWEDTDAGGIVFYANYLKFFERARTEWLRALGVNQEHMRTDEGVLLVVGSAEIRYRRPAHLDDLILVSARLSTLGGASLTMDQEARLSAPDGPLLCTGTLRVACVSSDTLAPRRFPKTLAHLLAQA